MHVIIKKDKKDSQSEFQRNERHKLSEVLEKSETIVTRNNIVWKYGP